MLPGLNALGVGALAASLSSRFLCRRKFFFVWSLSLSSGRSGRGSWGLWVHMERVASLVHRAAL